MPVSNNGGYSKKYYSNTGYLVYEPPAPIYLDSPSYLQKQICRIEIYKKNDNVTPIIVHDMSLSNNTYNLTEVIVSRQDNEQSFSITFLDDDVKTLTTILPEKRYKVKIFLAKKGEDYEHFLTGWTKHKIKTGVGPNTRFVKLTGVGEKSDLKRYLINLQRTSTNSSIRNTDDDENPNPILLSDSQMTIANLIREAFSKTDVRIAEGKSIAEENNLDLSGIDDSVDGKLKIYSKFGKFTDVINELVNTYDAYWDIVDGKVIVKYPQIQYPKYILTTTKANSNDGRKTALIVIDDGWSIDEDSSEENGQANTIYTETNLDQKSIASSFSLVSSMITYNRFLFQSFRATDTRFNTIILRMSRLGNPDNDDPLLNKLKGEIRIDNPNFGDYVSSPTGPVIATFEIDTTQIKETPDEIFVNDIKIVSSLVSQTGIYYIYLYPYGKDMNNCLRWHHNNSVSDFNSYSGFAVGSGSDLTAVDYRISDRGPTFNFDVIAKIKRVQKYFDPISREDIGTIEDIISIPAIDDIESLTKIMQIQVSTRSLIPRVYSFSVIPPNGIVIKDGDPVLIFDDLTDHERTKQIYAKITGVQYSFSESEDATGMLRQGITALGYSDPLEDLIIC